jgi:DNA-directed RNA polymerase alpha subunit
VEAVSRLDKIKYYIDCLNKEYKDFLWCVNRLTEIERQEIYSINLDDLQRRLNIKIQDISDQLSVRTMNILNILKFKTLKDIAVLSDFDILRLRPEGRECCIGRKSLKELKDLLKHYGLSNNLKDYLERKKIL